MKKPQGKDRFKQGEGVSGRCAFTIIELLVVISIIALLLSILLPALQRARIAAMEAVCMSNERQMGIGFQVYCDNYHGYLPDKGPDGSDNATNCIAKQANPTIANPHVGYFHNTFGINDPSLWYNAIPTLTSGKPYYQMIEEDPNGETPAMPPDPKRPVNILPGPGQNSIFVCPLAAGPGSLNLAPGPYPNLRSTGDQITDDGNYFWVHAEDTNNPGTTHVGAFGMVRTFMTYVMNSQLFTTTNDGTTYYAMKMSQLRPASSVILLVEKITTPSEYKLPDNIEFKAGEVQNDGFHSNIGQMKASWTRFTARHRKGGHLLFADGHVAWFSWYDVNYPTSPSHAISLQPDANQPSKGLIWNPMGGVGAPGHGPDD